MNAVEAGLGLVFAVTGQVEGEDSESIGGFGGRGRDLYVLLEMKRKETVKRSREEKNEMEETRDFTTLRKLSIGRMQTPLYGT